MLAVASWSGLFVSVWSALGPLFLPLVGMLINRYELSTVLTLCFLVGALQAALIAAAGFVPKQVLVRLKRRLAPVRKAESLGSLLWISD